MKILLQTGRIERAAARWAARLDRGPLDGEDREELQAWLGENPRHLECLRECLAFSNGLNEILKAAVPASRARAPAREPALRPLLSWGAAGLAAALVVVLAWGLTRPHVSLIEAARPEAITLFDGTRAELSAGTRFAVSSQAQVRSIKFFSGHARFTVRHDAARPFVVDTSAGIIRDVGTVFDVSSPNAGKLVVTVYEGSVQFEPAGVGLLPPKAPMVLEAGERVSVAQGRIDRRTLASLALRDAAAWREGGVVFQGVPLREAVARVADYNHAALEVAPDVPEFRLGGRFQIDDLPGFLESLRRAFPLQIASRPDGGAQIAPLPSKKK